MNILSRIRHVANHSWTWVRGLPPLYSIGGSIVVVAVLAVGIHAATRPAATDAGTADTSPHVTVESVSSLSAVSAPLSVVGKVSSLSQATLLAQASGGLTSLSKKIGDRVGSGEVIGQLENSSQRAAVLQAEGVYEAALASQSSVSPAEAGTQARNTYISAYTTLDSALNNYIDVFFGEATAYGPLLLINSSLKSPQEYSKERQAISYRMDEWRAALKTADNADPLTLLNQAYDITSQVSEFVTELANTAHETNSGATASQLSSLATGRGTIATLLGTISTARNTYRSSSSSATTGADATLKQAQGALAAARANLEKTIIRAPISGTIVSLPLHIGDYISAGTTVAAISNPTALEVDAHVTADDAKSLKVGGKAVLDGGVPGTILSIAPALDPLTGKIEVKIGIEGQTSALTDGDTVSVSLSRSATTTPVQNQEAAVSLPITAIKITPDGPVVFTVSEEKLVAHAITLGSILGDRIVVLSGITPDMEIVTDARGLAEGDTVIVN